jgi:VWFA-related protein
VNKRRLYPLSLIFLAALACSVEMYAQGNAPLAAGTVRYWITATKNGHPVSDLTREDLQLWIGKQKQSISVLAFNPPEALRVGLLVDMSGSQKAQWPSPAISLAVDFFRRVICPGDQAFIIHFNDVYYTDAQLTDDLRVLDQGLERLASVHPYGGTALYDAIVAACYPREAGGPTHRALVLITDGMDDASRYPLDRAMAVVGRTGTQLYVIGTGPESARNVPIMLHSIRVLRSMADATGGAFIPTSNKREMEPAFNSIAELLRAQYALEYQPAGVSPGKEGNRIKIKCSRPGVEVIAPADY